MCVYDKYLVTSIHILELVSSYYCYNQDRRVLLELSKSFVQRVYFQWRMLQNFRQTPYALAAVPFDTFDTKLKRCVKISRNVCIPRLQNGIFLVKRARLPRPRANLKRRKGEEIVCAVCYSVSDFFIILFQSVQTFLLSNSIINSIILPSVSCPRQSIARFLFIKLSLPLEKFYKIIREYSDLLAIALLRIIIENIIIEFIRQYIYL